MLFSSWNINDSGRTRTQESCLFEQLGNMPDLVNAAKIDHWNSESDVQVIVAESSIFCNYMYFWQSQLAEIMMMMTKPSGGPIRQRGCREWRTQCSLQLWAECSGSGRGLISYCGQQWTRGGRRAGVVRIMCTHQCTEKHVQTINQASLSTLKRGPTEHDINGWMLLSNQ